MLRCLDADHRERVTVEPGEVSRARLVPSRADTPAASVNVVARGDGSLRAAPSEVSLETSSVEARRGGAGMSYAGGSLEAGEV